MEPGREKGHDDKVPAQASDAPNVNATLLGSASGGTRSSHGIGQPPEQGALGEDLPRPAGAPSGTIKRPCRVPGCATDVSGMKSFNWRYRICEDHRSAASVIIDGLRVRFCQMCAKFHELNQFQGEIFLRYRRHGQLLLLLLLDLYLIVPSTYFHSIAKCLHL